MEGEDEFVDPYYDRPIPPRPLNVMLANPRETGVAEYLEALREGKLDDAKTIFTVKKLDPNISWDNGPALTGLHITSRGGHVEFVKFLIEAGADVNRKEHRHKKPIHLAASSGHAEIIQILIEAGSGFDDMDKFGRTPLLWATTGNHVESVRVLLQAGASVTSQGHWHAIHEACKKGYTELVQLLIDAASPVNNPRHFSGGAPWSPLHIAVRQGHLDCVKLLIRAGADVNSMNAGKHTPLHEAAYRGFDDIMLELLLRGADPHAASNQKRTPLHEACMQGKVKAVVMLLDIGSKVNGRDVVRDTPLHLTLRADHAYDIAVQLTTILLQYGASPTLLGRDDDMPLDIARLSGQSYCLELLEMALEMPQPLTNICKVRLRKQLACHHNQIEELPLPSSLKCFLINNEF